MTKPCCDELTYTKWVSHLHAGDVPLDGRRQAIAKFAEGGGLGEQQPLLICTDLAARWAVVV